MARSCGATAKRSDKLADAVDEVQAGKQDRQEHDVAGDQEALRVDLRADALRDAERDAADQRAPQRAGTADHDRLEGEDQLLWSGVRIEVARIAMKAPAIATVTIAIAVEAA